MRTIASRLPVTSSPRSMRGEHWPKRWSASPPAVDVRPEPSHKSSNSDRDVHRSAHRRGVHHLDLRLVDAPLREAGEGLLEHDAAFEPGEARAEAEVDAVAERHMPVEVTRDIETIG